MATATMQLDRPSIDVSRILGTGLLVAFLDGTFAVAYYVWLLNKTTALRIFQNIANAVVGKSAFDGGFQTGALGLLIHVCVALGWTIAFATLLSQVPAIRRAVTTRTGLLVTGFAYGTFIWLVMDLVVLPLSNAKPSPVFSAAFNVMLAWHAVGVGLPIVAFSRRRE